jgi:hypothetical protein
MHLVVEVALELRRVGVYRVVAAAGTVVVGDVLHQSPDQDGPALFGPTRPGEPLAAREPLLEAREVEVWFDQVGLGQHRAQRRLPVDPVHGEPHLMAGLREVLRQQPSQPLA